MRILSLLLTASLLCGCSKKPAEVVVTDDAPAETPKSDTLTASLTILRTGSPDRRADAVAKGR